MRKTILIMILVIVASFLIFSLSFSQGEKTPSATDTAKKEMLKQETTAKQETAQQDTAKKEMLKQETTAEQEAAKQDTTKKEAVKQDTTKKEAAKAETTKVVHKYIGTAKCKMCHNSEAKGKIYDKWASTGHAQAYLTLANEQSKSIAKNMQIEDAQKSAKCLKCHVTGYKEATGDKYSMEEGVTCEACHGPGEHYWLMKVMQDKKLAMQNGLVEPTEKLCVKCHNQESPTYKEFKYAEAYKLIEHHAPKAAPKTEKK
jgi:FtsZ-interacting cell division protein ZipA